MKKISTLVIACGVIILAAFAFIGVRSHDSATPELATNGAFRDGMYQAKLDEQSGRQPHLRSGRWSSDVDRASFIAGYRLAATRSFASSGDGLQTFRQGLNDGNEARTAERPIRTNLSENSLTVASNSPEQRKQCQRTYADGYQIGYYGEGQTLQSELNTLQSGSF